MDDGEEAWLGAAGQILPWLGQETGQSRYI